MASMRVHWPAADARAAANGGSAGGAAGGAGAMSKAMRMMKGMGWSEGEGLGRERQGMATPIILQKTDKRSGVIVAAEPLNKPAAPPPAPPQARLPLQFDPETMVDNAAVGFALCYCAIHDVAQIASPQKTRTRSETVRQQSR